MTERLLVIELTYERTGQSVSQREKDPSFIRGDTIDIVGKIYGKALTGLTATLTGRLILPDGTVGPAVFTKTSGGEGAAIVLTVVNDSVSTVRATISSDDTKALEPGNVVVFDVEFETTTTPPITRSIKGRFAIEEDYTLN